MAKDNEWEKSLQINLRISPDLVKVIDEWRRQQFDIPNRSEAIRRLVEAAAAGADKPDRKKKAKSAG